MAYKILDVDVPVYVGSTPEVGGLTIQPAGASLDRSYFWGIYPQRLFVTFYEGVTALELGKKYNVLYGYTRDEDVESLPDWATGANRKFNKLTIVSEIINYLPEDYPDQVLTTLTSYLHHALLANEARQGLVIRDGDSLTIRNAGGAPYLAGTVIVDGSAAFLEVTNVNFDVVLQFPIDIVNE